METALGSDDNRQMRAPLLVQAKWLAANLDKPNLRILDSTTRLVADDATGLERPRGDVEGFEAGHIPGARLLDLQRDLSAAGTPLLFMAPRESEFAASVGRLGIDETSHVVVYSRGNPWWATRVWWVFRLFGLDNISVLDGGWKNWLHEQGQVETGPARPPLATTSAPSLSRRELIATREMVLAAIADPQTEIVNALPAESFSGKAAPSTGRPGRIAGSVSLPAGDLLDAATGRFLPAAAIAERLGVAGLEPAKQAIAYCGGGVAASAIVFAAALAGRNHPLLYDGSMQEWAVDDSLPMEVG